VPIGTILSMMVPCGTRQGATMQESIAAAADLLRAPPATPDLSRGAPPATTDLSGGTPPVAADPSRGPPLAGTSGPPSSQPRRPNLLSGPIVPTMLRLAGPTVVVLIIQTLVGVIETYFVGFLGTDALAGVALVFPVLMLMQMMSNGGIGGGVSSAIARATGAGRYGDAEALVWHAILIAILFGFVFTV